jgi:hypothetical protein
MPTSEIKAVSMLFAHLSALKPVDGEGKNSGVSSPSPFTGTYAQHTRDYREG